jgi:hypothetical protein
LTKLWSAVALSNKSQDIEQIGPLYAGLMEEIKRRTEVVKSAMDGQFQMPAMTAFELCYLQLRKICESLALGCIVVHGDVPGVRTKLLQKEYNADQIIKQLGALHPSFYPVPGKQLLDPLNQLPVEVIAIEDGFLTKDEFMDLYGECGNYLHRGSARQLLTKWEPDLDFPRIAQWLGKIVKLLNHHQIQTVDPEKQFWVLMHNKDDGKVHWNVMQRIGNAIQ